MHPKVVLLERAATNVESQSRSKPCHGVTRSGMVNGKLVGDILLDTDYIGQTGLGVG